MCIYFIRTAGNAEFSGEAIGAAACSIILFIAGEIGLCVS